MGELQVCMCGKYHQSRRSAALYLLYHDDVGAEHFETSSEEHDVAPAQNQAERHHDGLALHLAGPEHAQQHHQAGVADTGGRGKTKRSSPNVSDHTGLCYFFIIVSAHRITWKGPPRAVWPK